MRAIFFVTCMVLAGLFAAVPVFAEKATAVIRGTAPDSEIIGKVKLEDTPDGLWVWAKVKNVPSGKHGFHIHEFGDCSDLGKGAGDHYNPDKSPHGLLVKDGHQHAHAGDLGNIRVDENGVGRFKTLLPKLSVSSGPYAVAGRSVILHDKPDDFGQPLGNAGGRIGCGKIFITKE